MRVLVVDDSAFMRKIISEMIAQEPGFEVIALARDGEDGVNKALELKPDLITLDIEMPRKNGLDALREIKVKCHEFKPAVLMCSSLTVAGSQETLKALRLGASDFIAKDPAVVGTNDASFRAELVSKIKALREHRAQFGNDPKDSTKAKAERSEPVRWEDHIDIDRVKAIVVGSSTGGPPALEEIFSRVPGDLRVPIIVAQHMPGVFTKSLASRLDQQSPCKVRHAENGVVLHEPGIYIAQGGAHTKPTRVAGGKIVARQVESLEGAIYRPSVDHLFAFAAEIWGESLLAIELTGMGNDGAEGAVKVRELGGKVIAQSGESCVVFGMPRAVIEAGAANVVLSPAEIGGIIAKMGSAKSVLKIRTDDPNQVFRKGA